MRILYLTQYFHPLIHGGGERVFLDWSTEMSHRGHSVKVIAQALPRVPRREQLTGISVARVGPPVHYRSMLPPSMPENATYYAAAVIEAIRQASDGIDVIHSNTYVPALAGQTIATALGVPHIITFHDIYSTHGAIFWTRWGAQAGVSLYPSLAGKAVELAVARLPATRFHVLSETTHQDLRTLGVTNVTVIPTGINPSEYPQASSTTHHPSKQLVYVGRLVFYKNLDTVIRALPRVISEHPDVRFSVIGEGPEKPRLVELAKTLNVHRHVRFMGVVAEDVKKRAIRESAALLLPSSFEGFGLVVLEALACRVPALVSASPPLTEIIKPGETGLTADAHRPEEWADRIIHILSDPDEAREMGRRGRQLVETKYDLRSAADSLETLYRSLATPRGK